jgi:cysteine-rich repeat protein
MNRLFPALLVLAAACGDNLPSKAPVIGALTLTTMEDTAATRTLPITDDGDALTIVFGTPAHGTITNTGASVTYTPVANYNGTDSVSVMVSDGANDVTETLSITVTPVNDAPVVVADSLAGQRNMTLVTATSALLANDTDIDGDTLTVTAVAAASMGTVALAGTTVTYTPPAGFAGTATFMYTVSDGSAEAIGTVTVTISGGNQAPVAVDDTATTAEDMPLALTSAMLVANDTDPDGQTLSVMSVSGATNGTVVLAGNTATFTPTANYSGPATFDYVVTDGTATDTGTVAITVTPVNDAPVANDDVTSTPRNTALVLPAATLLANDTDVDGPTPTITAVANPTNGTVALAGTTITFTPTTSFTGAASFEYTLSDGTLSDTATVMVNVNASNVAPVAVDDTATTAEDMALTITAANLATNDTDGDGDALMVTAVANATSGTVALSAGTITFTPAANFNGAASFEYTVSDGTATDTGVVAVTVTPVNDAPVAVDDAATTTVNVPAVILGSTLAANDTDVDLDPLTVTAAGNATNGTVLFAAGTVTFTPTLGFTGTATFEYTVSDGTLTDTGLVTVAVGPAANTPPVATDDTASTTVDTNLVVSIATLVANDIDPDPQTLTITAVANPTNGTVVLGASDVTFTPTTGFTGTAGFDYTVSDGVATDTGHVTITVMATNTPPVATDDTGTTPNNANLVVSIASLVANDIDPDPQTLTITAVSNPTGGTVVLGATDVTFTPTAAFVGTGGFDYTVSDGMATDTGHVTITVTAGNTAPVATDDTATTPVNTNLVVSIATLVANDIDPDPQTLTITAVANPTNGTVVLGATDITFTPTASFGGTAGFDYTVSDGTATDTGHVTITVPAVCGDGATSGTEQCDDTNVVDGDGCSATCQDEALVAFTFTGANGNEASRFAETVNPLLTSPVTFTRGSGLTGANAMNTFSSSQWTADTMIDADDYVEFTVGPMAGNMMTLMKLKFGLQRSSTGPDAWAVRSSLDTFAADIQTGALTAVTTLVPFSVTLGAAFANLTAPVTFRIYGYHAGASGGTLRQDNVSVVGTVGP